MQDTYSQQYADLWHKHWWWQARHQVVLRQILKYLPAGEIERPTLLDIGCCGGVAFDDLDRFGDIYGIEPDPLLVDSEPRWRHRVRQSTFGRDFRDERAYDVVLMLDVLEHIEDHNGALKSLHRVLKPGGHAIITVPALPCLWSVHDEVNHHFCRYRKGRLGRLLGRAGLEIVDLRFVFTWTIGLMYVRKWLTALELVPYSVTIPPKSINAVFRALTLLEQWCLDTVGLRAPIGSSLLAVARRPVDQQAVHGSTHEQTIPALPTVGNSRSTQARKAA